MGLNITIELLFTTTVLNLFCPIVECSHRMWYILAMATENPVLHELVAAAKEGLGERLKEGPLVDTVTKVKAKNDVTIQELVSRLDLRYGISEWLNNPQAKVFPVLDSKTNDIWFYIRLPHASFYREEGEHIVVAGLCQTHAAVVASLINASTQHGKPLVQAMHYQNSYGITHVIPEVTDPSLAAPLERNTLEPSRINRRYSTTDVIRREPSDDARIYAIPGTEDVQALFLTNVEVIPFFSFSPNGTVQITGIEHHSAGFAATIEETQKEGQIHLSGGSIGEYLFIRISGKPENHSWIVVNLTTGEKQRFDYGKSRECKKLADLISEKLDLSRFREDF